MFASQMMEMDVDLLFSKQHYDDLDYIKWMYQYKFINYIFCINENGARN